MCETSASKKWDPFQKQFSLRLSRIKFHLHCSFPRFQRMFYRIQRKLFFALKSDSEGLLNTGNSGAKTLKNTHSQIEWNAEPYETQVPIGRNVKIFWLPPIPSVFAVGYLQLAGTREKHKIRRNFTKIEANQNLICGAAGLRSEFKRRLMRFVLQIFQWSKFTLWYLRWRNIIPQFWITNLSVIRIFHRFRKKTRDVKKCLVTEIVRNECRQEIRSFFGGARLHDPQQQTAKTMGQKLGYQNEKIIKTTSGNRMCPSACPRKSAFFRHFRCYSVNFPHPKFNFAFFQFFYYRRAGVARYKSHRAKVNSLRAH